MLETNRKVLADVVDIDIDSADGECRGDYLQISGRMFDDEEKFCGIKKFNKTMNNSRVYIRFNTDDDRSRRGFKVSLSIELLKYHLKVANSTFLILLPPCRFFKDFTTFFENLWTFF